MDEFISSFLSGIPKDHLLIESGWKKLKSSILSLQGILSNVEITADYLRNALKEISADNIQHVQIRTSLLPLCRSKYDSKGLECHKTTREETADILVMVAKEFEAEQENETCGTSFIISLSRRSTLGTLEKRLELADYIVNKKYPDYFLGFDLVGQEDFGKPLIEFAELLVRAKEDFGLKFFFHAGETDWLGTLADLNLVDAVLLETTRIGHGYTAIKHPLIREQIKNRKIAIEVCPISNQVLGLINDLRNHPAIPLIQEMYPIVIASDDFAAWNAQALSDDFYEVFIGMSSSTADIRLLKQLILNSITFSELPPSRKDKCSLIWKSKWTNFIRKYLPSTEEAAIGV